jgi:nitrite reductase/ring-hydroxylating ferredoxin subunit
MPHVPAGFARGPGPGYRGALPDAAAAPAEEADVGQSRVRVGTVEDVPRGQARVVEAGGHALALCNVEGRLYAVDNTCPHRGGPLGEGTLEGAVVACPWHAWRWDVTTGANVNNPAVRIACFAVSVEGGEVFVDLPA